MFGTKWSNNKKIPPNDRKGFTLVEIIVVIAIIVLVLATILGFLSFDSRLAERSRSRLTALALAQETIEAVRNFRDNTDWVTGIGILNVDINYHPIKNSSGWNLASGNETLDGFTRAVVLNKISRDSNDNIESSYNSVNNDPDTRRIKVTVTWTDRQGPSDEILITYLTNWKK